MTELGEKARPRSRHPERVASISVSNFKPFSRPATLPLRPITLIYGENSSGKSSLLQSLLMLKQSILGSDEGQRPGLLSKGPLVNLGSFRELINRHDISKSLVIELSVTPNRPATSPFLPKGSLPLRLSLAFDPDRKSGRPTLEAVSLATAQDPKPAVTFNVVDVGPRVTSRSLLRGGVHRQHALKIAHINNGHPIWRDVASESRRSAPAELTARLESLRSLRSRLAEDAPTARAAMSALNVGLLETRT
jgi:hypothetical protein